MTQLDGHKKVKNWDKTRCLLDKKKLFMEKEKMIFWDRGQEKVILLAGDVVHGSGEFDQMGQEKVIRWDRRRCIWVRRV
jgi:hypothetical protein